MEGFIIAIPAVAIAAVVIWSASAGIRHLSNAKHLAGRDRREEQRAAMNVLSVTAALILVLILVYRGII